MRDFLTLVVACMCLVSCGTKVTAVQTGTPPRQMYPRPPSTVEVFTTAVPQRAYVEVGLLEAQQESGWSQDSMPQIIEALRTKAAELGCDAIVLTGSANTTFGTGGTTGPYTSTPGTIITLKGYGATCIVYTEPAYATAPQPAVATQPVAPAAGTQPVATEAAMAPGTAPAAPAVMTPEQEQWLRDWFESNSENALWCLQQAEISPPATVGIEVKPDGTFGNWGCKEEGLQKTPACDCILKPFIGQTFWQSTAGFKFMHIYQ